MQLAEIRRMGSVVNKIALPVLAEQFFITVMGVINTILAANLGSTVISGIGMIDSINNIIIALFNALALGGTVAVAQYTGHNDLEIADQAAGQAVSSTLVFSSLITLLLAVFRRPMLDILFGTVDPAVAQSAMDYLVIILWSYVPIALASVCFGILRGAGDTVTPMVISILMNVLNVLFSLVLIYGLKLNLGAARLEIPALGVRGAALGLTLARVVGMFLVLIPLIRGSKKVKLGLSMFRVRLDLLRCIFRIGIPASAEQLMFQGGRLITQIFIARLGTAALATNTIAGSIDNLSLIPGMALGTAATALIGQRIGARKPQEAKRQLVFLVWFASVTMALSSVLMVIVKQGFIHLYTQDAALSKDISLVLTVAFLVQPLVYATSFVLPGGLRGAGDIRYTMLVSIVSMWILRIFLGYIFSMILPWGVMGIWIAMFIDWLARSIFFIRRISRQEWLNRAII